MTEVNQDQAGSVHQPDPNEVAFSYQRVAEKYARKYRDEEGIPGLVVFDRGVQAHPEARYVVLKQDGKPLRQSEVVDAIMENARPVKRIKRLCRKIVRALEGPG